MFHHPVTLSVWIFPVFCKRYLELCGCSPGPTPQGPSTPPEIHRQMVAAVEQSQPTYRDIHGLMPPTGVRLKPHVSSPNPEREQYRASVFITLIEQPERSSKCLSSFILNATMVTSQCYLFHTQIRGRWL